MKIKGLPPRFDIKHWRAIYDSVQSLGARLKRGRAKEFEFREGEEEFLDSEINIMMENLKAYMDKVGLKMPPPLWQYDPKDPTTAKSSETFAYGHLCGEENQDIMKQRFHDLAVAC